MALKVTGGGKHRLRTAPVDLPAYAASGCPTRTMGRSLRKTPSSSRPPWRQAAYSPNSGLPVTLRQEG